MGEIIENDGIQTVAHDGTYSKYLGGCRCSACREANRVAKLEYRQRKRREQEPEQESEPTVAETKPPTTNDSAPAENTRKALASFLSSVEGQDFTMEIAKQAAQVTKKARHQCSHCRRISEVEIPDANGSINALKFMHDWGARKPQDGDEVVPRVKSLRELTPKQVDALREIVYTRASQELER